MRSKVREEDKREGDEEEDERVSWRKRQVAKMCIWAYTQSAQCNVTFDNKDNKIAYQAKTGHLCHRLEFTDL